MSTFSLFLVLPTLSLFPLFQFSGRLGKSSFPHLICSLLCWSCLFKAYWFALEKNNPLKQSNEQP